MLHKSTWSYQIKTVKKNIDIKRVQCGRYLLREYFRIISFYWNSSSWCKWEKCSRKLLVESSIFHKCPTVFFVIFIKSKLDLVCPCYSSSSLLMIFSSGMWEHKSKSIRSEFISRITGFTNLFSWKSFLKKCLINFSWQ